MNLFSPAEIAKNYITTGQNKANMPFAKMFVLAIMAGVFIGLGGVACTVSGVSIPFPSVGKLIGAMLFPGGLTMVLLAGGELFTGNCLLSIPLLEKKITVGQMIRNWIVVYLGNLVGGLLVAAGMVYSHTLSLFGNGYAVSAISTAASKATLSFGDALIRGIFCNFLVCLAVWISFAAKDVAGKIIGLFFPVMIFVLAGFEHSVANMYFIPAGLLGKGIDVYAQAAVDAGVELSGLTWSGFFVTNLIPVTIGNIIGGAICVGWVYWFCFLKKK